MDKLYGKIKELSSVNQLSKHEQIVRGVTASIEAQLVERGEILPSINKLSEELGWARKTVTKAYAELKSRGLIESRNRLGYFVATNTADLEAKVAIILYALNSFQESFYDTFRQAVGEKTRVDAYFHHNNLTVFEDVINKVSGHYGLYVVAPIVHERTNEIVGNLPEGQLLLVDRYLSGGRRPQVVQRFEKTTGQVLNSLLGKIGKYRKIVLFYNPGTDQPPGIYRAVKAFVQAHEIDLAVHDHYMSAHLERGALYLTIGDGDLWYLLEDCIDRGLVLGRDVGVLAHNESIVKKLIHGGVSTWSTDFGAMAKEAARWVHERHQEKITIPTVLIDRGSL